MACESEWDAYQQAIADRIASEIIEQAAIAARQAAQMAEWNACMAWWYCGEQGMRAAVDQIDQWIPSSAEAKAAHAAAKCGMDEAHWRAGQLRLEYHRVTGKPYEPREATLRTA